MPESIYYIGTGGDVRVLELPNDVYLGQFYCDSLKCKNFEVCAQHRLEHGDFDLLVIGDEEAQLSGGVHNAMLTDALGCPFFGAGLLVCLHAVGEDGDDSRLADVGCIYKHIEEHLSMSLVHATHLRARPLKARVKELLHFFEKLDPA